MDKSCALNPLWDIQQSILYIGQTVRALDQQMKEHNRALTSGNAANSAVEYGIGKMHWLNWEGTQVVDSRLHYNQWCTLEVRHITSKRNNVNGDVGPLPATFYPLFDNFL